MSSDGIFLFCTRNTVLDDEFWNTSVPGISETARATLTTRIKAMQSLMNSTIFTAASLTSQVTVEGQLYIIMVTRN